AKEPVERARRGPMVRSAHAGPATTTVPSLLAEVPLLVRLEREVEQEFRPLLRARLVERIAAEAASLKGTAPRCDMCGKVMECRGRKPFSFTCRFGEIKHAASAYRCPPCRQQKCPLIDKLGVEVGRLSGSLARLVGLLGILVPYELGGEAAAAARRRGGALPRGQDGRVVVALGTRRAFAGAPLGSATGPGDLPGKCRRHLRPAV